MVIWNDRDKVRYVPDRDNPNHRDLGILDETRWDYNSGVITYRVETDDPLEEITVMFRSHDGQGAHSWVCFNEQLEALNGPW